MKIKDLSIKNFTAFEQANFKFCDGINVLIGTNGTGKTHAMKAMYALVPSSSDWNKIFNIKNINNLIRNNSEESQDKNIAFGTGVDTTPEFINSLTAYFYNLRLEEAIAEIKLNVSKSKKISPIYLPTIEMLSIYDHFFATYERREIPYDRICYDLALALNAAVLRKNHADYKSIQIIINHLQQIITDSKNTEKEVVVKESEHFYFNLNGNKLDVNLVADGYRKLGTLFYLLRNGSLTTNSILFWDEPEANLNPKLIVKVAKVLQALAAAGMQIFIATHDYLLSHELSLLAEYPSENPIALKFFSLYKPNEQSSVIVEEGQTLADIANNPILDEFAAHYDREVERFNKE
jgi:predicted ATP-dependent endonuclease of OLD family